jgi:hypothetical protein
MLARCQHVAVRLRTKPQTMELTMKRRVFEVGDTINIDSASGYKGRGQIQAIRHESSGRPGSLYVGADVLREDGRMTFYFLHDIARWNADTLAASFK